MTEVELVVQVSDSATNSLSTECPYTVLISDENDNGPIFSQSSYKVAISELTALDTVVFTLACTDADEGRNGELDFTISSGNEPTTFDIHPRSGSFKLVFGIINIKFSEGKGSDTMRCFEKLNPVR